MRNDISLGIRHNLGLSDYGKINSHKISALRIIEMIGTKAK